MKSDNRRITRTPIEIRAAAGRAPHQRGSALLIVIGTLALVAVFAAVYVSIGRTDRRAADAFEQQLEQRDVSEQAGELFADTIGIDRLEYSIYYSSQDPNTPLARRDLTDTTYTDWTRRTEVNLGNPAEEALLFTPSGGVFRPDGLTATTDYRVSNDPWLASTTPTFLGDPGLGGLTDTRPFSSAYGYDPMFPNAWNYLDNRDWLQISNFAPDGRPVNLFNLRPHGAPFITRNIATNSVGGFDAEPGYGESPRASDGRPIRRMSNYLSLLDKTDPTDPQSLLKAFDPAVEDGVWLPGYADIQNPGLSGAEYYNTPAVWTMYQRYMFMPMNQPFVINNREGAGNLSTWADPDYPPYQYADADGDGFADSRWFEFTSARDSNSGDVFGSARDDISRFFDQGDMRYFFAARAIDLSSMVNVNTATDQLALPTAEYPTGLTPAEVDLRRLLTMQDVAHDHTSVLTGSSSGTSQGIPLSLSDAPRPYTDRADLAQPRIWDSPERQDDFLRNPQDYQFYQATISNPTVGMPDIRVPDVNSPSMLIGRYAYSALRRAVVFGGTPGNRLTGQIQDSTLNSGYTANLDTDLVQYEVEPGSNDTVDAEDRYTQYTSVGLQYAASPALTTSFAGLFGLDDLSELLTYHGINDPDFTSRLERVVDARFDSTRSGGSSDSQQTLRLSPLLSNRDLTLDRLSHSQILGDDFEFDMRIPPSTEFRSDPSRIGEVSRNSMALMALTPRKRMTTLSGFTPLSIDDVITDVNMPQALSVDSSIPPLLSDLFGGASTASQELFTSVYSNALAGELGDMDTLSWEPDPTLAIQYSYSSLFYGHRGPELALRIAAHNAVNMADMADSDTNPSVATLILDDTQSPLDLINYDISDGSIRPETEAEYQLFPGVVGGNLLNPGTPINNSNLPAKRNAVNVYGIEAMPVITEVSMLYAFTDAPHESEDEFGAQGDLFGDEDYNNSPLPRIRNLGGREILLTPSRGDVERVTINTAVDSGNHDYLMQVLAVQIHNPFDVEISLGGSRMDGTVIGAGEPLTRKRDFLSGAIDDTQIDPDSNYHFDYYLEYAGRFFKLAEYIEWYPAEVGAGAGFSYYATDDPTATVAYNTVPNPADAFAADRVVNGARMPVTEGTDQGYPDFITRNVMLQPGETRVFYAIADQRFDGNPAASPNLPPDLRWEEYLKAWARNGELPGNYRVDIDNDGLFEGYDGREWTGPAEEWVNDQLTVVEGTLLSIQRTRPIHMMSFDPTDGSLLDDEITFEPLNQPPATAAPSTLDTASRTDVDEVRLWKKIVTRGEEYNDTTDITGAIAHNLIENDLLVDRMSIQVPLESSWSGGSVEIEDTWSYPEWFPLPGSRMAVEFNARNDNTGLTIADWVTNRRKDSDSQTRPSIGQVTPWMLRSSSNPSATEFGLRYSGYSNGITDATDPNAFYTNGDSLDDPLEEPEIRVDNEIAVSLREFFQHSDQAGYHNIVQTIALEPYAKSDVVIPYRAGANVLDNDAENDSAAKFANGANILTVASAANLDPFNGESVPEIKTSMSAAQRERPRLTDLLMAWGIGPTYAPDPLRAATSGVGEFEDDEWMTLTEALAVALGYEQPVRTSPDEEADSVWAESWDLTNQRGVLDEGRLALDRYVPFVNTDTTEDPIEFNPDVDILRGLGIPTAQGVVDRARVFSRLARVTDTPSSTPIPELELTNIVPGAININTAPIEVLRLLPGLSPSRASYIDTPASSNPVREWWGARSDAALMDTNTPDGTLDATVEGLSENPDIPAAIVAYRDRMFSYPNTSAHVDRSGLRNPVVNGYFVEPLNGRVHENHTDSLANNFMTEDTVFNAGGFPLAMDRQTMTGIDGLRRTPGFSSVGELLSVRLDPELESTNRLAWENLKHLSIEMLGRDGIPQFATEEFGTSIVPQTYGDQQDQYDQGSTVDDYSERLALASGVMNMISVRSDIYAVWFVVQGYRESDVANLRPEDPLVPSLHKRYLMVVDRSNVVEPGDKPKILMLKEIPL